MNGETRRDGVGGGKSYTEATLRMNERDDTEKERERERERTDQATAE